MNPSGLCKCGCGEKAPLSNRNETQRGYVKGQPLNYCKGHAAPRRNLRPFECAEPEKRAEALRLYRESDLSVFAIATRTGVTESTIKQAARRAGLSRRVYTWETAKWANGALAREWIKANIAPERLTACDVRDVLINWTTRDRVSVWAIDRVFVTLGLHIAQVPDEIWIG